MFKPSAESYIYPEHTIHTPSGENLFLPIEIDTEYTHPTYNLNNPTQTICQNLTVQCRAIVHDQGRIYAHPENDKPRHRTFKHGFVALDYLEDYGLSVALSRLPSWKTSLDLPIIQFDIYAFFAVAEIARIFQGEFNADIQHLITNPTNHGIEQGRRLRTYTKAGNQLFNFVEMPWLLKIEGYDYRVRLAIYDTCATHGMGSYASLCNNSGVKLDYKDKFSGAEKGIMNVMYTQRPDDFDNYALGDLYNHKALIGNSENFYKIYQSLKLEEYYTPPRLTIGATVSRMMEAGIKKLFNADANDRNVINAFCKFGSADWLKRKTTSTGCLNAKVDGGRCRNNRPLETSAEGVLCDIDISGCYGEGLRVQVYPLGVPIIIDYPIKSSINRYLTLRQFLKRYGKELVPGLWQARVSVENGELLKYSQDYLASWYPPKDLSKMPTDSDFADTDQWWTVDNVGEIKIFTNEVNHAIITHDFIQWLDNVASPRQRKEMLDRLMVETAMFYPASERVESVDLLMKAHTEHKGKNTTEAKIHKGRSKKIAIEMECHAWFGINLGDLLVNKLLIERKKYPKKTAFNDLYKLCVNTVYGDMVSPFFTVGNVVVGNNITARARALAWCMEKGFHGWQTITDGCAFDLNRVLYPRPSRSITGEMVVNLYADVGLYHHTFSRLIDKEEFSLTGHAYRYKLEAVTVKTDYGDFVKPRLDIVEGEEIISLSPDESLKWVDRVAMQHLRKLFPNLDILHQPTSDVYGNERIGQFEFETKGLFDRGTFHGTANYSLSFGSDAKYAMRSYSKRNHKTVVLADDLQVFDAGVKPSEDFLSALSSPKSVKRSAVYIKERILKVGDFRRNFDKWKDSEVYPGCTVEVPGLLHEFSLSQFTFQNYEQLSSWRKEYDKLLRCYGQSYEMFFLNDDGTLDYQKMIMTVGKAIYEGKKNFFDGLDKRTAHIYRSYMKHGELDCLNHVRKQLGIRYHGGMMSVDAEGNSDYWGDDMGDEYSVES